MFGRGLLTPAECSCELPNMIQLRVPLYQTSSHKSPSLRGSYDRDRAENKTSNRTGNVPPLLPSRPAKLLSPLLGAKIKFQGLCATEHRKREIQESGSCQVRHNALRDWDADQDMIHNSGDATAQQCGGKIACVLYSGRMRNGKPRSWRETSA